MKKNLLYIFSLASVLCSCNDFLDKEPLDAVPTDKYLLAESDLAAYSANLYDQLPSHTPGQYSMGVFATDNNSDNKQQVTKRFICKGRNTCGSKWRCLGFWENPECQLFHQ